MSYNTAKCLLFLLSFVNSLDVNINSETNESIHQEIMHQDSKKINAKTTEMMRPCSKYMTEIRRRLGLPLGSRTGEVKLK